MTNRQITLQKLQRTNTDISITRSLKDLSLAESHFADDDNIKTFYMKQYSDSFKKIKSLQKVRRELENELSLTINVFDNMEYAL